VVMTARIPITITDLLKAIALSLVVMS